MANQPEPQLPPEKWALMGRNVIVGGLVFAVGTLAYLLATDTPLNSALLSAGILALVTGAIGTILRTQREGARQTLGYLAGGIGLLSIVLSQCTGA